MIPTSGEPLGVLCQPEALGFLDRPVEVQRAIIPRVLGVPIIVSIVHPIIRGLPLGLEAIELAPHLSRRCHDSLPYFQLSYTSRLAARNAIAPPRSWIA